jgi:hypothetical protein
MGDPAFVAELYERAASKLSAPADLLLLANSMNDPTRAKPLTPRCSKAALMCKVWANCWKRRKPPTTLISSNHPRQNGRAGQHHADCYH